MTSSPENWLEKITDLIDESIVITNASGVVEYVNAAFRDISGYSTEEVVGKSPTHLINLPDDISALQAVLAQLRRGQSWEGILYLRKREKGSVALGTHIHPLCEESGKTTHYLAVSSDLTRERGLEKQIQELQRLESLGTLANGVAHRFNNLLAAISGHTELLMMTQTENKMVQDRSRKILDATNRGRDFVSQLSAFSRKEKPSMRPFDLANVARHAVNFIRSVLPRNVFLEADIPEKGPQVMANSDDLHQVLVNVLTNAIKVLKEEGGTINLRLTEQFRRVHPGNQEEERRMLAVVSVQDTGPGIPENIRHRIFEPFFTTHNIAESSGMGLAVAHGIIQRHGGEILFETESGKGTRFEVLLPSLRKLPELRDETTSPREAAAKSGASQPKGRILLV